MATVNVELLPFELPTHAVLKMPPGLRQDGLKPSPTIRLVDLPRDTVAAMCDELRARALLQWDEAAKDQMVGQHVVQR